jgi:hypothetical protein
MKTKRLFLMAACAAFVFAGCQQVARASQWNKRTILHVYNPIQIPGTVLTPGTYTMQLATPGTDRSIVQFINDNNNQAVATVVAVPDQAAKVPGRTRLTFYEPAGNNPPAIRTWFYPGSEYGVEFVYPESEARVIARASNRYVPTMSDSDMQNFQRQQASNSNAAGNARLYSSSPNGTQVSNEQGFQNNARMDQNQAWQKTQQTYHRYADVESGTGTNGNGH